MKYRRLTKTDFKAYEALRKEALKAEPEAFGASEKQEAPIRAQRFDDMLNSKGDFIIGAFEKDELIGMCGLFQFKGIKASHKGMIWGVYVKKEYRQQDIGKQVVSTTVEQAWKNKNITLLQLGVGLHNFAAINLYSNIGFESFGVEKRAFRINNEYIDEYLMAMFRPGTEEE